MPTPSGLVTKQELINAQLDTAHLGRVVNSKDAGGNPISTSTNRTGGANKTLDALQAEYLSAIQSAGGDALNNGVWTAGETFTAYNQYMVYNGVPYKPEATTTLPYGPTGAVPDFNFVQPYVDISANDVFNDNLINNSNFETAGSVTNPPDATPRDYLSGDELFQGFKTVGAASGVTYVNGTLDGTGQIYVDVVKTTKMQQSTSGVVASIAASDGKPVTAGVTVNDNGQTYRVTFDLANVFSVKLEQGVTATRHRVRSLFDIYGHPNMGIHNVRAFGAKDNQDSTQAFIDAINSLNQIGGTFVSHGDFKVSKNLTSTKDNCLLDFIGQVTVVDGVNLDKSPSRAVIEITGDNSKVHNINLTDAGAGLEVVAIRVGDFTYDEDTSGTVTAGKRVSYSGLTGDTNIYGLGRTGVGAATICFAATNYGGADNIKCFNSKGQHVAIFGGNKTVVERARSLNNGEAAFYMGSQQYNRIASVDCDIKNGVAIVNNENTGIFAKISRGAINCSMPNLKCYAYGSATFNKVDQIQGVNAQPPVWLQGGVNTSYPNLYVELNNLSQQTISPLGLYVHGTDQLPLDIELRDSKVSGKIVTNGCPLLAGHVLVYPIGGGSARNIKIHDFTFDSDAALSQCIQGYINDPDGGTIEDLQVYNCTARNGNLVRVEKGPNAKAGVEAGNIYVNDNVVPDNFSEKIILTGDDVYESSFSSVNIAASSLLSPVTAGKEKYKHSIAMRLFKSATPIDVNGINNLSDYPEQAIFTINASFDMANVTLKNGDPTGRMMLIGGVDRVLVPFDTLQFIKIGVDLVEIGRR